MRPPFDGERQATSAERRAQARRGALSACRGGVGCRSVVRLGDDVLMLGCVIVWRICSAGVAVSGIVSGLSYHAHARARAAGSRRPCDNVYIIARYSPAPGGGFQVFSSVSKPGKRASAPLPPYFLAFSLSLSKPTFTSSHTLQCPLSLKISPSIEFLSFRQANYALNLK